MGYRINVRNFKRASVTADTDSSYTLGNIVAIPTLRSVDISFKSASGELYGDGELVSNRTKMTGASLSIGIDKLTLADKAAFLGSTETAKGTLPIKTTDTPGKVAVYFEIEHDDGGYEAVWLLVGTAQPLNISAQQTESNINYSTETLNIDFVRREKDKAVIVIADTDDASFTSANQTAFLAGPDI